jgi:hypothetical protein
MKSAAATAWAEALERAPAERLSSSASSAPSIDWRTLTTRDERVEHCADLIAKGEWQGRKTARRLALAWGVERGTASDYGRDGALLARTDRGSREHAREEAIGRWMRLFQRALHDKDWRAAALAERGWDRAAGVVELGAKVQVLFEAPGVRGFVAAVLSVLATARADGVSAAVAEERFFQVMEERFGGDRAARGVDGGRSSATPRLLGPGRSAA